MADSDNQELFMAWLEISVECDQEAVESVSELLAQSGYNGGVAVDQPIIPGDDGPEFTYDPARPVTVRTYLPLDERVEETRARIEQALWHLGRLRPIGELRVRRLEEEDWENAWKQYYAVQRIGARTVIVPSWQEYVPRPDDIVLRLDPGMAFGTGLHPSTRLCIAALEEHVRPGDAVLDLGTGSGVLAIAAYKLGAVSVLATDIDPIAVDVARENALRNGIPLDATPGVTVQAGSVPEGMANRFDVIVANILAEVLVKLFDGEYSYPSLAEPLKPGGALILAGIIEERAEMVVEAARRHGCTLIDRKQEGDWVALVVRKA
jgi:ribosomal protein L11 methyltransferase